MLVTRPPLRFAQAALALTCLLAASTALAIPIFRTNLTNGSQHPLVGMEWVTLEAGSTTPSARTPIYLDEALMPGQTHQVAESMDPSVAARGGQQQLRWYWTSDRACWGYVVASPSKLAGGANTGERFCDSGKTPAAGARSPAERMEAVNRLEAAGDVPAAMFELTGLMAEYPGQAQLQHRRGEIYLGLGNEWAAEKAFRAEAGVDIAHTFYDQSLLQFARGEGQAALASLGSAIRNDPGNIAYLMGRADLSCLAGDREQMRADEAAIVALGGPKMPPRDEVCRPTP